MNSKSLSRWISLGALACAFIGVDLLLPLLVYANGGGPGDDWIMTVIFGLIGVVMGQVAVLAVWAAYAPQRLLMRLVGSLLLTLLVWCAIQLGADLGYEFGTNSDSEFGPVYAPRLNASGSVIIGGMILIGFFAMQGAMWIVRLIFGWRLRENLDDADGEETRFGLLQLMIWTGAVGVVTGICRFVLPNEGWQEIQLHGEMLLYTISSLYPVIIAIPSVWACLRNKGTLAWRLLGLAGFTLGAAFVEGLLVFAVMQFLNPGPPPSDAFTRLMLMSLSVNFGQAAALICTLLVVRLWGYRLVGRQRAERETNASIV